LSTCFSKVEMNTSPIHEQPSAPTSPEETRRSPQTAAPAPYGRGLAHGDVIGLTRDELGDNDTDYPFRVETKRFQGLE
jgi:hypothetical protein